MDFVERWFGVSPDGGDGTTEALYILALCILVAAILMRRPLRRWLTRWRSGL